LDTDALKDLAVHALEDIKGIDIKVLDVRDKTTITDVMIIATGNTARQVKALVDSVVEKAKKAGVKPIAVEGEEYGEWALVDLGDIVVHVMQPAIRDFYNLEKLWGEQSPPLAHEDHSGR
jgi:ribosome-associated protein